MHDNTVLRRHAVQGLHGLHASSLLHRGYHPAQARPGGIRSHSMALCRQDRLQNLCATVQVASGMTHSMALCAVPATEHESDDGWGGLDSVSTPDPQGPKLADARRSWVTRAVRVAQGGVPAGATRKMGMGSASDLRGWGRRLGSGHPPPAGRQPPAAPARGAAPCAAFGLAGLCSR